MVHSWQFVFKKKKTIMKQLMFIALALLLAACEKPVLDNEDAVTKKDANVILHFKQYEQAAFDTDPTPTPPL